MAVTTPRRVSRVAARRASRPAFLDPHQYYSIDETAAARDQPRASLYHDTAAGIIRPTKIIGAEIIRANREQAGVEVDTA